MRLQYLVISFKFFGNNGMREIYGIASWSQTILQKLTEHLKHLCKIIFQFLGPSPSPPPQAFLEPAPLPAAPVPAPVFPVPEPVAHALPPLPVGPVYQPDQYYEEVRNCPKMTSRIFLTPPLVPFIIRLKILDVPPLRGVT